MKGQRPGCEMTRASAVGATSSAVIPTPSLGLKGQEDEQRRVRAV